MNSLDRVALIDGDEIAYLIALKFQTKRYIVKKDDKELYRCLNKIDAVESIGNGTGYDIESIIIDNLQEYSKPARIAIFNDELSSRISDIARRTSAIETKVFLSSPEVFRTELATILPYKGTRDNDNKPIYLAEVKDCMRYKGAMIYDLLEADDALSATATTIRIEGEMEPIICSSDKDLRTVPGYNFNIGRSDLKYISERDAMFNFYHQILIGDSTDNIPSPYMLGDVSARKILTEVKDCDEKEIYEHIVSNYATYLFSTDKNGLFKTKWVTSEHNTEEVIYEVANLLWMHRTFDHSERWVPPNKRD